MSYGLSFWRCKPGVTLDHQDVYERLSNSERVDGVEDIPIDVMLDRISQSFSDWDRLDRVTFDGGDHGGFQLFTTPQFLRVDCHQMDGEDMDRFIDLAAEFECCLYDPQTGQRYD